MGEEVAAAFPWLTWSQTGGLAARFGSMLLQREAGSHRLGCEGLLLTCAHHLPLVSGPEGATLSE